MKNKIHKRANFPSDYIPKVDESKLNQTIRLGQEYIAGNIPQKTPRLNLFLEQIKYISPILWATQFLALIAISAATMNDMLNLGLAQSILFRVAPLTAIFAVPELVKDALFSMSELEKSCKNSGGTILSMRLVGVGAINLIMLSIFTIIFAGALGQNFFSLILYALIPYNFVNIINLFFITILKIKARATSLAVSLLAVAVVYFVPMQVEFSTISGSETLLAIFVGATVILAIQIYKLFKSIPSGGAVVWN